MSKKITRAMLRERKNAVNELEELIIVIKQHFPKFYHWINSITDKRQKRKISYSMKCIVMVRILALCCGIQSMNEITKDFNTDQTINNINLILSEANIELPHRDTIINVLKELKVKDLENLNTKVIKKLVRSKVLNSFRIPYNGKNYFHIVIDGTGLFSRAYEIDKMAITKTYNKGSDDEYTIYSYYVLEAKLICGDMVFSVASEFVENTTIIDENGNENWKFNKQDCELKAAYRLLDKIKKIFPKTPIIIGGDALYVKKPFFEKCLENKFEFIVRYKDTTTTTIAKEFDKIEHKITDIKGFGKCEFVNDLVYGSDIKNDFDVINIIQYIPETNDELIEDDDERIQQIFKFVTSLKISKQNQRLIITTGRNRWKIENHGFRDQKEGVINIGHAYCKDYNATKCNYLLSQIAHTFLTLLNNGSILIKATKATKKDVSKAIKTILTSQIAHLNQNRTIQLRLL